jgi:hypothetical protein
MVKIHLSQEWYAPGDELRVALIADASEALQLMSIRCLGYVRMPGNAIRELPDKDKYIFKDKPIGPELPSDSFLLWYTPNYPVHTDSEASFAGLVKLFLPFFLPPSIRGGLFEICHFVEIAILKKGEIELRLKRLPLRVSSFIPDMPIRFFPAVGDGYDQFDYSLHPTHQSTTHGDDASSWEADYLSDLRMRPANTSLVFRTRRTFKISFSGKSATEIHVFGEWAENLVVESGSVNPITFRFDQPEVHVKRIRATLIRTEAIWDRPDVFETTIWTSNPFPVSPHVIETSLEIPIPLDVCPSFVSKLLSVSYRVEFELRAVDPIELRVLDPVVWSMGMTVKSRPRDELSPCSPPLPLGTIKSLIPVSVPTVRSAILSSCDIDQIVLASTIVSPGTMKFKIHS